MATITRDFGRREGKSFFGHPRGLAFIGFTEACALLRLPRDACARVRGVNDIALAWLLAPDDNRNGG
jgi:hypothetical protein